MGFHWAYFVVYSEFIGPLWAYFVFVGLYWAHFANYEIPLGLFYHFWASVLLILSFIGLSLGLFCRLWAIQWAYFVICGRFSGLILSFIGSHVNGRKPGACFTFGANFWAELWAPFEPKLAIYCHISNTLFTAQCACSGPIELILFWSRGEKFSRYSKNTAQFLVFLQE